MFDNNEQDSCLDTSSDIPKLRGRRIDMLDIISAIESGKESEHFEYWNLSEKERKTVIEYYNNNQKYLNKKYEENNNQYNNQYNKYEY